MTTLLCRIDYLQWLGSVQVILEKRRESAKRAQTRGPAQAPA